VKPAVSARLLSIATGMLFVLAFAFLSFPEYVFHLDEVQLTLGLERFDLRSHQPHPPGYYLFVLAGRLLRPFVVAPEDALRAVAAFGAALFAGLVAWRLPAKLHPWARAGFVASAAAVVIASPLLRFHSVSALTYTAESACWLAILLALACRPRGRQWLVVGAFIGLAGGLRQTLIVWGVIAVVASWLIERRRPQAAELLRVSAGLVAGIVVWAVPMLVEVGGIGEYVAAAGPTLRGNIWEKSIFHEGLAVAGARLTGMLRDIALAAGPLLLAAAACLVVRFFSGLRDRLRCRDLLPLGAAIAFVFHVALIYDTDGYVLSSVVPLAAYGILAPAALVVSRRPRDQIATALAVLLLVLAIPVTSRLVAPDRGYPAYATHDTQVAARVEVIRRNYRPAETVLVTSHEYWQWSFRHVMYYLPEYTTVQLIPDRFYADAGPERPYLTGRGHEVRFAGPDGLDLRSLGGSVRQVVYMIPHDVTRFVHGSCAALLRPLPTTPDEVLGLLQLDGSYDVRISRAQLHCVPAGARRAE